MTAIDPQMEAILLRLRAGPHMHLPSMPIEEARRHHDAGSIPWSEGAPPIPAEPLTVDLGDRQLRARLYRPTEAPMEKLTIFVHGGGWTFGSIDTHDGTMRNLAVARGSPVLGFDYRLAPEHPFPAGLDDTLGTIAFVERGGLGVPLAASSLALAGDSAGANLVLGALLARRDAGLAQLTSAALFYGCYAPNFDTASHITFGGGDFMLTSVNMRWYWGNFLGAEPEDTVSLAAPLRADLAGLPPLYLAALGLDPLRDDTLMLAARLTAAGIAFRCDHVPGVVHGCLRMSRELDAARRMIVAGADFIASHLDKKKLGGHAPWNAANS